MFREILIIFLAFNGVLSKPPNFFIMGGQRTAIQEAPYQAALLAEGVIFCGGTIIGPRFILTAAHCVTQFVPFFKIRVGSSTHSFGGQLIPVAKIHVHPKYLLDKYMATYDFAVIELAKDIDFSGETVRSAQLPKPGQGVEAGTMMQIFGWGSTTPEYDGGSETLQGTLVKALSDEECAKFLKTNETDVYFCAGILEGGKDTCEGDSGGGLFYSGTVFGVTSFSFGKCGQANNPGIYAKVSAVIPWIKKIMGM